VGGVKFPMMPQYGQTSGWTDVAADASVLAEYRIKGHWGINATFNYNGYFSKTTLSFPNTTGTDQLAYQEFQAMIGARWFM